MESKKISKREVRPIEIRKSNIEQELQKSNSTEVLAKAIKTIFSKNK